MEVNQHLLQQLRQPQQRLIQLLPQPQLQHPQQQLLRRVVTRSVVTPQGSNPIQAIVTPTSCVRIWAWDSGRSSTSIAVPDWPLILKSRPVIGQKMCRDVRIKGNQRLQFSPEKYCLNVQMLVSSLTSHVLPTSMNVSTITVTWWPTSISAQAEPFLT